MNHWHRLTTSKWKTIFQLINFLAPMTIDVSNRLNDEKGRCSSQLIYELFDFITPYMRITLDFVLINSIETISMLKRSKRYSLLGLRHFKTNFETRDSLFVTGQLLMALCGGRRDWFHFLLLLVLFENVKRKNHERDKVSHSKSPAKKILLLDMLPNLMWNAYTYLLNEMALSWNQIMLK